MSLPRSEIAARLEESTRPLIKHLIKLYLYPNCPAVNHWRHEVYMFLHNVSLIKRSNKLPSSEFILKNTLGLNRRFILVWKEHIEDDYLNEYGYPEDVDEDNLIEMIYNYYTWLADQLSRYGEVSRSDTYRMLKYYGFGD